MSNSRSNSRRGLDIVTLVSFVSSIIALIISLITGLYNLVGYFEKPELTLLPPEQLTLYASYAGDWPYVTMVTNFNVFNRSRPEKYGLVVGQRLEFTVDNLPRVLRWQQVGRWGEHDFLPTGPAQPFAIAGGAVTSQEVSFEPRSKHKSDLGPGESEGDNWIGWDSFLQLLKKGDFKVRCVVELHEGKTLTSDVEVLITPGVIAALENPDAKNRWAAARCKKL